MLIFTLAQADEINLDSETSDLFQRYLPHLKQVQQSDESISLTAAPTPTHEVNVMPDQMAWVGESITVWGNSSLNGVSYEWDFDDGTPVASGTISDSHYIKEDHTYAAAGVYNATLTIDATYSEQVEITVIDKTSLTADQQLQGDVNIAIENGLEYLYLTQQNDGSWNGAGYLPGPTGFSVLAFLNHGYRAQDPGSDPTGITDSEIYAEYIYAGLKYLFMHTKEQTLSSQPHGDPDPGGLGGYYYGSSRQIYETGIILMTLSSTGSPTKTVTVSPTDTGTYVDLNGKTYKQVAEGIVRFLAWAQTDSGDDRGGWRYTANSDADNSNAQWPAIGLQAAERLFGIAIPAFVKTELEYWINTIQKPILGHTDDGSSGYTSNDYWNNTAKTGALLAQMEFVGDTRNRVRVLNAMDYIENHWNDTDDERNYDELKNDNYYAVYSVFKGLFEISKTPGAFPMNEMPGGLNWRTELDQYLVSTQESDGKWPTGPWFDRELSTAGSVLSLMRTVVGHPFVTTNSIDISGFPSIALIIAVDSTDGNAGSLVQGDFEILENQDPGAITSFAFDSGTKTYNIVYTSPNDDENGAAREVLVRVNDPDKGVGFDVKSYTAPLTGLIVRVPEITDIRGNQIFIPIQISYLPPSGGAATLAELDITSMEFTLNFSNVFLVATDVTTQNSIVPWDNPFFHISNGQVDVSMAGVNAIVDDGDAGFVVCNVQNDAPLNRRTGLELSSVEFNEGTVTPRVFHGSFYTEECKIGDVNGDGNIDAMDANLILQYSVGILTIPNSNYPCFVLEIADVSNDGTISAFDASYILAYSVELISDFPRQSNSSAPELVSKTNTLRTVEIKTEKTNDVELRVPIWLDNLHDVYSAELALTYNPDMLEFESVSKTENTQNNMLSVNDNNGLVRIALAADGQAASGNLFIAVFSRKQFPEDNLVNLKYIRLNEGLIPVIVKQQELPESIKLWQSYPNPSNPETWIPYQLTDSAKVQISIYDVSGNLIRSLSLGRKEPGFYLRKEQAAYWDGKNSLGESVSSGVYFYTLKAVIDSKTETPKEFIATKKLLLVK